MLGYISPILVDQDLKIIAGNARLEVAKELGYVVVPCIRIAHLNAAGKRALSIADNRLAELAQWDMEMLASELSFLSDHDFSVEATGFSTAEIDIIVDKAAPSPATNDPNDLLPAIDWNARSITESGDLWHLGRRRLYCGDALDKASYEILLGEDRAQMVRRAL